MILRKVTNDDGKIVYEPIDLEDAVKINKNELVFTDESDEDDYEDLLDELEDEEDEHEEDDEKEDHIAIHVFDLKNSGKKTDKNGTNFKHQNPKVHKIIAMLPFLDENDINEMVGEIIAGSETYQDVPLVAIMPFVSEKQAARLFMNLIEKEDKSDNITITSIVPFVSGECLDALVDAYIAGKYQYINMDLIYPFLNSSSIKKLFKYMLNK